MKEEEEEEESSRPDTQTRISGVFFFFLLFTLTCGHSPEEEPVCTYCGLSSWRRHIYIFLSSSSLSSLSLSLSLFLVRCRPLVSAICAFFLILCIFSAKPENQQIFEGLSPRTTCTCILGRKSYYSFQFYSQKYISYVQSPLQSSYL